MASVPELISLKLSHLSQNERQVPEPVIRNIKIGLRKQPMGK
jgi:hypothetical protein